MERGAKVSLAEVLTPYREEVARPGDRTPPQDMDAEQCVLGAMMMSKDAIADVVETLADPTSIVQPMSRSTTRSPTSTGAASRSMP